MRKNLALCFAFGYTRREGMHPLALAADGKTTYFEALREQHFLLEALRTVRVVDVLCRNSCPLD